MPSACCSARRCCSRCRTAFAPEHAALTEPLAVGIHAVEKAAVRGNEVPLVIGCGPVGLAVIAALKLKGLHPIVAADYSPARRALAAKLGADIVVDPAQSGPYATWADHAAMSAEEKAARPPHQAFLPALKPALIFECVGIPGMIQQVFEGAARDARIVVVGVCMESDRSEPMLGIMKELNVQYVLGYTPEEFARSLRLIADGEVDAAAMVTATVGIEAWRRPSPISPIRKRRPRSSSSRGGRCRRYRLPIARPVLAHRALSVGTGTGHSFRPRLWRSAFSASTIPICGARRTPLSGLGSEIDATAVLRAELPPLLARLGVTSLLDAPCGDAGWINRADLACAMSASISCPT